MAASSLFAAPAPHVPVDVLLLVENSSQMACVWNDLRDRYLAPLMLRLQFVVDPKPPSTTVWVLESQPSSSSSSGHPRQYHEPQAALLDVRLDGMASENPISYERIEEAVNFLESLRLSNQPRALHLLLIAASSPSATHIDAGDGSAFSPWYGLAHKLGQANIYCHLLMHCSSEDMSPLTILFEETLRTQGNMEDLVSFAVDANYAVRLSMSPKPQGQFNVKSRPQRIPMPPRRNTFPLAAGQYDAQDPYLLLQQQQMAQQQYQQQQQAGMQDASPTLVSQLQQMHGLTKKNVYGAKPSRKPFFRDEQGAQQGLAMYHPHPHLAPHPHAQQPTHHGIPPSAAPLQGPTYSHDGTLAPSSGRAMTMSKADRIARLAQLSPTADPRGHHHHPHAGIHSAPYPTQAAAAWVRRGSRASSPDVQDQGAGAVGFASPVSGPGSSDISPPTSYMSSNVSSPVSPASVDDYYGVQAAVNGGSPDPSWLRPRYASAVYGSAPQTAPPHQQAFPQQQQQVDYYSAATTDQQHPAYNQQGAMYGDTHGHPPEFTLQMPPVNRMVVPVATGASLGEANSTASHGPGTMSPPRIPPPLPVAPPVAALPTSLPQPAQVVQTPPRSTSTSTTHSASAGTTPRSTKKTRPSRPEDEEYIDLDENFVKDSTELFNELFPNTENFPESSTVGKKAVKGGVVGAGVVEGITTQAGMSSEEAAEAGALALGGAGAAGVGRVSGTGSPASTGTASISATSMGSAASASNPSTLQSNNDDYSSPTLTCATSNASSSLGGSPEVLSGVASGSGSPAAHGVGVSANGATAPTSAPPSITPPAGTSTTPAKGKSKKKSGKGKSAKGKSAKAKLLGKASNNGVSTAKTSGGASVGHSSSSSTAVGPETPSGAGSGSGSVGGISGTGAGTEAVGGEAAGRPVVEGLVGYPVGAGGDGHLYSPGACVPVYATQKLPAPFQLQMPMQAAYPTHQAVAAPTMQHQQRQQVAPTSQYLPQQQQAMPHAPELQGYANMPVQQHRTPMMTMGLQQQQQGMDVYGGEAGADASTFSSSVGSAPSGYFAAGYAHSGMDPHHGVQTGGANMPPLTPSSLTGWAG